MESAAESYSRNALENTWIPFNKAMPLAIVQAQLRHQGQLRRSPGPVPGTFSRIDGISAKGTQSQQFKGGHRSRQPVTGHGRQTEAQQLLDGSSQYIQGQPRLGDWGYWIDDVRIQALRGENDKALTALRAAVDKGWRIYLALLSRIRPDTRTAAQGFALPGARGEIRADMAAQLTQVRSKDTTRVFARSHDASRRCGMPRVNAPATAATTSSWHWRD